MTWPSSCPPSDQEVLLDVGGGHTVRFTWGDATAFGTAAYWIAQYLMAFGTTRPPNMALGDSLLEETIACLLGGHGVPAEVAYAAFLALKREGLLNPSGSANDVEEVLCAPISLDSGCRRYRFAYQRSRRIAAALHFFASQPSLPSEPLQLRESLLQLSGVGLKTASWIVRNYTGSDEVAIVDIHLRRAGITAGFFADDWSLPRDYLLFENAFLAFAGAGGVPAAGLDMLIWDQMRRVRRQAPRALLPKPGVGLQIGLLFPAVQTPAA